MPRLRLIAGPNGSGKTTLTDLLIKERMPLGQYMNPDDIAKHIGLEKLLNESGIHTKGQITPDQKLKFACRTEYYDWFKNRLDGLEAVPDL